MARALLVGSNGNNFTSVGPLVESPYAAAYSGYRHCQQRFAAVSPLFSVVLTMLSIFVCRTRSNAETRVSSLKIGDTVAIIAGVAELRRTEITYVRTYVSYAKLAPCQRFFPRSQHSNNSAVVLGRVSDIIRGVDANLFGTVRFSTCS